MAVCGRVSSLLDSLRPLPPLPFMVKERMRLEREEATRLLEEETEVRDSLSTRLQASSRKSVRRRPTSVVPFQGLLFSI